MNTRAAVITLGSFVCLIAIAVVMVRAFPLPARAPEKDLKSEKCANAAAVVGMLGADPDPTWKRISWNSARWISMDREARLNALKVVHLCLAPNGSAEVFARETGARLATVSPFFGPSLEN